MTHKYLDLYTNLRNARNLSTMYGESSIDVKHNIQSILTNAEDFIDEQRNFYEVKEVPSVDIEYLENKESIGDALEDESVKTPDVVAKILNSKQWNDDALSEYLEFEEDVKDLEKDFILTSIKMSMIDNAINESLIQDDRDIKDRLVYEYDKQIEKMKDIISNLRKNKSSDYRLLRYVELFAKSTHNIIKYITDTNVTNRK